MLVHGPLVVTVLVLDGTALVDWGIRLLGVVAMTELVFVPLHAYSGLLLMGPAIIVEQIMSPTTSAQRSWELARGSRCYLMCTILCLSLFNQIVTAFFGRVLVSLLEETVGHSMDFMAFNILMAILYSFFFLPVRAM